MQKNIIIIGGGIAGLTAAIHLSKEGLDVTLIEKNTYPQHKVCGEYISNEVLPYLNWLDANPMSKFDVPPISHLLFSTENGKTFDTVLPLGGFGISRFCIDEFLYNIAVNNGCNIIQEKVSDISFNDDNFQVQTASGSQFSAAVVLGAFGKRSNLDIKMKRPFIDKESPWLAVKQHYKGHLADDTVGLHCFSGGYCGVSKVEDDTINICYLTDFATFKKYKDIDEHREQILYKNPTLKAIFDQCKPVFEKPLTISQISFENKNAVENHVLMIGDTAGLINPLCGNGMAMAFHSAKMTSDLVVSFLNDEISRAEMERSYEQQWKNAFTKRIRMGRRIASLFRKKYLTPFASIAFVAIPGLLKMIINSTHGDPIKVNATHEYNV